VGDAQELDAERTRGDSLSWRDVGEPMGRIDAAFVELGFDERECKTRAVDRARDPIDHMRDGTDVIFMTVGQDQRFNVTAVRIERREIWNDEIDAEELRLGEHDTGIYEERRLPAGDEQHVHAELAETAERNDINRRGSFGAGQSHRAATSWHGRCASRRTGVRRHTQIATVGHTASSGLQ
jgi:hypothetical protein